MSSVTATDLQNLIVASLSFADTELQDELNDKIPFYWNLHNRSPYKELQYWLTRRDMIRVAMGCTTRQVDYLRRTQDGSRVMTITSRADATMTASSEDNASSVADRSSTSEYNDEINSSGTASSNASRNTAENSDSTILYDDTGHGESYQSRLLHSLTTTLERGEVETKEDDYQGVRRDFSESGFRVGGTALVTTPTGAAVDWNFDPNSGAGVNVTITFPGINVIFQVPPATTLSFILPPFNGTFRLPLPVSKKVTNTNGAMRTHNETLYDDTVGTVGGGGGGGGSGGASRQLIADIIVNTPPRRQLDMLLDDHPARAHSSYSQFTADVVSSEITTAASSMTASSASSSNDTMTGEGLGTSSSSGTSESSATGIATRVSHSDAESHRTNQGSVNTISLMEKLHQRFLHLQELWTLANETIKWLQVQRLALTHYTIARITIEHPEGFSAEIANNYLTRQPYQ